MKEKLCPCCTGNIYDNCCKPFHDGSLPKTALELMRSRYSAYALCLPNYIISTTHPNNSQSSKDSQKIIEFCKNTEFNCLEILDFKEMGNKATVAFKAHLSQNKKDASFTEVSTFEKVRGKWLYRSGKVS